MPYTLKKTDGGYKVCLKANTKKCFSKEPIPKARAVRQMKAIEAKEGGRRGETYAQAKEREEREYKEWKQRNEEAKSKAYKRTAREAKDAQLYRLTKQLEAKKQELATKMGNRPAEREQMIKNYNDDIEKLNNYDYYSLTNTRLRDALDKQYGQMLRNMGTDMYTYGELPGWVFDNIGDPKAIKYVYEHYGQAKPNFWDTFNDAVSFVGSMIPGMGTVFNVLDTVRGTVMDMTKSQPKELEAVDYNIINEDFDNQLQAYDASLEQDANEMKTFDDELAEIEQQKKRIQEEALMEGDGKPANMKLYDKIKSKVYKEQPKHSLYRSARIQREYKDAGGTYVGDKPGNKGIKGWMDAKWISLNDYAHEGEIRPCGSVDTQEKYGEYPLCRPLKIAKKLGRHCISNADALSSAKSRCPKILEMLKVKDDLKEKPLITEKLFNTDRFNIQKEMVGLGKPLTARLGGKVLLKKAIVGKFFPNSSSYETYIEPFVGGGSVYFYKDKDDHKEIVNDLDPLIYNIFKGFQKYPAEKIADAVNGNYTVKDFNAIKASQPTDDFQKFIKLFLLNRLSYFAKSKSFGKPRINSTFEGYQERLDDATILNEDWKSVINKYNTGKDKFFYLDPPFVKSDSSFSYDAVDLNTLKKFADKIDKQGNKFLITFPARNGIESIFKGYNIHHLKTKYVGQRTRGGQTIPSEETVVSNYVARPEGSGRLSGANSINSGSGKFGKSDEKKALERGEKSSDAFMKQLEKLKISPDDYMTVARHLAKSKGYDPDKLAFASDGDHKLLYESPEGLRKFGKVGYGDYIIWSYLERMGKVPKGTADQKRNTFQKSHRAMSKEYGLRKYSPNELALNINW
jgi:DNA adenine methylase